SAAGVRFRRSVRRLRNDHRRRAAHDGRACAQAREPRAPASPALLRDLAPGAVVAPESARAGRGDRLTGQPQPSLRCSAGPPRRERLDAVLISPTCENACGKLPRRRRAPGSYSSDRRPTSLRTSEKALEECPRLGLLALQGEIIGQPEAAREKGALARGQPVELGERSGIAPGGRS